MRSSHLVLAAALGLCATSPARADTVTLKNGSEIRGRLVEETADQIKIRTGKGTITIPKAQVATFSENEDWGEDYGGKPRALATDATPDTGPSPAPTGAPAPGGEGGGVKDATGWVWPAGLSQEDIEALSKIRDDVLAAIEGLGPSVEQVREEMSAEGLSGEERADMDATFERLGFRQRQGSANMIRQQALSKLIERYKLRAFPGLVAGLRSDSYWKARMSAQGVGQLAASDQEKIRLVAYTDGIQDVLLDLMGHQGEQSLSPFMRQDANAAMEKLTGHSVSWPASEETLRTKEETDAIGRWRSWLKTELARWRSEQEEKQARRERLEGALEELRRGQTPILGNELRRGN